MFWPHVIKIIVNKKHASHEVRPIEKIDKEWNKMLMFSHTREINETKSIIQLWNEDFFFLSFDPNNK